MPASRAYPQSWVRGPLPPAKPAMAGQVSLTWHHSDADFCVPFSLIRTLVITMSPLDNLKTLSISRSSTESHLQSPKVNILWGRGGWHSNYHNGVPYAWKAYFSAWKTPTQFLRHSLKSYGNVTAFLRPLPLHPKGITLSLLGSLYSHLSCSTYFALQFLCLQACLSDWTLSHHLIHLCSLRGLTIKDCGEEK